MKCLRFIIYLAAVGCTRPAAGPCDEEGPAYAADPATGECAEFATPCEVPDDWGDCIEGGICDGVQCNADETCVEGLCVALGGGCTADTDCTPIQYCDFTRSCGVRADEADRAAPFVACTGLCTNNPGCATDDECRTGQYCDGGVGGAAAEALDPCDPDICGSEEPVKNPLPGLCRRGSRTGQTCGQQADCAPDEGCSTDWGFCDYAAGSGGAVAEYCPGQCVRGCLSADDCATNEDCVDVNGCGVPGVAAEPDPLIDEPSCEGICLRE